MNGGSVLDGSLGVLLRGSMSGAGSAGSGVFRV